MVGPYTLGGRQIPSTSTSYTKYVRIRGNDPDDPTEEKDSILCDLSNVSSVIARQPSIYHNQIPENLMSVRQRRRWRLMRMLRNNYYNNLSFERINQEPQPQPITYSSSFSSSSRAASKRKLERDEKETEEKIEKREAGNRVKCFISNSGQMVFIFGFDF